MELHHQLQSLVRQRGDTVLADPDVLRAALEDYLDEQSASTGDLNLLVDAVRLGGLGRLRSASQGGAAPSAAVQAAGDYLARQRGSNDASSAQWACAALGYAVGLVPDQIPTTLRRSMTSGGAAGYPPAGGPVMSPAPVMSPPPTSPVQQPWQSGPPAGPAMSPQGWASGPTQAPFQSAQPPKKSKAPFLIVGAAVVLLAIGGGIGLAINAMGDDGGGDNGGDTSEVAKGPKITEFDDMEKVKEVVIDDMNALESVNMAGTITENGEQMTIDLSFDREGRCTGAMQMQGGSVDIISDGQDEYLKGDEDFWIATQGGVNPGQATLDRFVGKWMKQSGTEHFGEFCNLSNLLEEFDNDGAVDFEVAGTSTVNGREAARLAIDGGDELLVSNSGPHHILRMSTDDSGESGEFTFSRFNEPVEINLPSDYEDMG